MTNLPPEVLARTTVYNTETEWLADRHAFIGASEIAGITGHSHWKDATPFQSWLRKTGQEEEMDPDRRNNLNRGNRAERAILGEYADAHLDLLVEPMRLICVSHPVYPRIRCTPDGLLYHIERDTPEELVGGGHILGGSLDLHAGVDAKFMEVYSRQFFGDPGTDDMPTDYVIQGLISCECLDVPYWDFAVWFGRNSYEEYRVERNTETAETLITQALSFYEDHVVADVAPAIDGAESTTRFLSRTFGRVEPIVAKATSEALECRDMREAAAARLKAAKEDVDLYSNRLRAICGNAEGIEGVCSWKKNKDSEKVDWKAAFQETFGKLPDHILDEIVKANTTLKEGSRVLRISKGK